MSSQQKGWGRQSLGPVKIPFTGWTKVWKVGLEGLEGLGITEQGSEELGFFETSEVGFEGITTAQNVMKNDKKISISPTYNMRKALNLK